MRTSLQCLLLIGTFSTSFIFALEIHAPDVLAPLRRGTGTTPDDVLKQNISIKDSDQSTSSSPDKVQADAIIQDEPGKPMNSTTQNRTNSGAVNSLGMRKSRIVLQSTSRANAVIQDEGSKTNVPKPQVEVIAPLPEYWSGTATAETKIDQNSPVVNPSTRTSGFGGRANITYDRDLTANQVDHITIQYDFGSALTSSEDSDSLSHGLTFYYAHTFSECFSTSLTLKDTYATAIPNAASNSIIAAPTFVWSQTSWTATQIGYTFEKDFVFNTPRDLKGNTLPADDANLNANSGSIGQIFDFGKYHAGKGHPAALSDLNLGISLQRTWADAQGRNVSGTSDSVTLSLHYTIPKSDNLLLSGSYSNAFNRGRHINTDYLLNKRDHADTADIQLLKPLLDTTRLAISPTLGGQKSLNLYAGYEFNHIDSPVRKTNGMDHTFKFGMIYEF